jgi:hypothetical protein
MDPELLRNVAVAVGTVGAAYYLWRKAKGAIDKVHAMRDELLAAGTDPAPEPEGPAWAWAKGVVALVIQREVDEAMSAAAAKMVLGQAWKVTSFDEARARIDALAKEHPELETLRAVRQIAIAWLGVKSATLGEIEAKALVVEATRTLRGLHASWSELGAAYVRELGDYSKSLRDADKQIATTKVRIGDLEAGLWKQLAFDASADASD